MERKTYELTIDAPRERVWQLMWSEDSYPTWTAPFAEGCRVETTWQEGSRVLFLDAQGAGMIAVIDKKQEPEVISFKHVGMKAIDGEEDFDSEKVKKWAGALETYYYFSENGKTRLRVEMDIDEEYLEFFNKTFPVALEKVREMSEKKLSYES